MLGRDSRGPRTPVADCLDGNVQQSRHRRRSSETFDQFGVSHAHTDTRYVDIVNPINTWRELSAPIGNVRRMSDLADTEMQRAIGERLRRVRLAIGLTQAQIVAGFGITITGWSAWENGRNTPDLLMLAKVARRYGFDTNYIAFGDMAGLRKDLADKLLAAPEGAVVRRGRGRPSAAGDQG